MMRDAAVDQVLRSVSADVCVDRQVLATLLRERPGTDAVVALLSVPADPVVRAAVVYIGLYGSVQDSPLLVLCLQHRDDGVAGLAEHCLWSLWMQAGSPVGNRQLAAGVDAIRDEDYSAAVAVLRTLSEQESTFAEAHFQLGLALCLLERTEEAARAYRETLRLNPYHFGAMAALGHANVELGNVPGALRYYRRALHVHPRMEDVRDAVQQIEDMVGRGLRTE